MRGAGPDLMSAHRAIPGWRGDRKVDMMRRIFGFLNVQAGLTRYLVLFVIELATRRVHIAGISAEPDSAWVTQCSRQLTDAVDGFLLGKRFLLHDRDPLFSEAFRETLAATGVEAAWAGQRSCVLTSNLSSAAPPRKERSDLLLSVITN